MKDVVKVYGFEMSRISEVYLSTLSSMMSPQGLERYFFALLYLCEHSGELTQKDLADAIRRDKVQTMRIVDYLCDKDLLVRKQDCTDRRCQLLEVTDKAKALVPKIKDGIAKTDDLLFHNFTSEEKAVFKAGMNKLFATINTLPDPEFIVQAYKRKNK
ncbi:MAG: MarR family transcriptional regulator [Flavobacteriales bacterium]|nr:MarR family transcriptional regulator [Flavobacteriales bacterium]